MSEGIMHLEARPRQVYVGVYQHLPHPGLDAVQEFVLDVGITATRALVLTDVVWRVYDQEDRVVAVRQRLGREAMHQLTAGQYGVAPGLGLALRRCYFLEQGLLPLERVRVSVAGYDYETQEAASAQIDVPLVYHQQQARLRLPLAEGPWWVIGGNDWTHPHKGEPVSWPFAYDFVCLGPDGRQFAGEGLRNEDHYAYGRPVLAPAAGKIALARDDMADQLPGRPPDADQVAGDPTRVAGNCVVIAHGRGEFSYLAHLKSGSVRVAQGEVVRRGQPVAAVGNSGQSPGPHLHYHLQNGPNLFVDQGLPVLFSDFTAAGDVVKQASIPARFIVSPAS